MTINSPPIPVQETPKASLIVYVWRGDKFDEIGLAMIKADGHLLLTIFASLSGRLLLF